MCDPILTPWTVVSHVQAVIVGAWMFMSSLIPVAVECAKSELLVTGVPGAEVNVDGTAVGSLDASGVLLLVLPPGERTVVVTPFGYEPIEGAVTLDPGTRTEYELSEFDLRPFTWIGAEACADPDLVGRTWQLVVRAGRGDCRIESYELGWEDIGPGEARWTARGAVVGHFSVTVTAGFSRVDHDFEPRIGETLFLSFDHKAGRVFVDHGDLELCVPDGVDVAVDGRRVQPVRSRVRDLPPGEHKVTVSRADFHPYHETVRIDPGGVTLVECPRLRPRLVVVADGGPAPEVSETKSALIVRAPAGVSLDCEGLGLFGFRLTEACGFYGAPPGRYTLRFSRGADEIEHSVELVAGRRVRLRIDPASKNVEHLPPTVEDLVRVTEMSGERGSTCSLAVSPDGATLVGCRMRSSDIDVWDIAAVERRDAITTDAEVRQVALASDASRVVALHRVETVSVHDLAYGHRVCHFETGATFNVGLEIDPTGSRAWTAAYERVTTTLQFTDLETGRVVASFEVEDQAKGIDLDPSGRLLAMATSSRVQVFDVSDPADPRTVCQLDGHAEGVHFSPDGTLIAARGSSAVTVWSTASWDDVERVERDSGSMRSLAWDTSGRHLAIVGRGVELLELEGRRTVKTLAPMGGFLTRVAFTPDGRGLLTADESALTGVWRMH